MAKQQGGKKAGALTALSVALVLTIALVGLNWHSATLNLGAETGLPLALGFVLTWVLGVLSGSSLMLANDKTELNQQTQLQWQAQDAKLMASVTSDREKQLEAKISTLEVALKTALKKREQ